MTDLHTEYLNSPILSLTEWVDKTYVAFDDNYKDAMCSIIFIYVFDMTTGTDNIMFSVYIDEHGSEKIMKYVHDFCNEHFNDKFYIFNNVVCCRSEEDSLLLNLKFT